LSSPGWGEIALSADIAALHKDERDLLVVSSGAIALGRHLLSS